jgi:hypothetical protein
LTVNPQSEKNRKLQYALGPNPREWEKIVMLRKMVFMAVVAMVGSLLSAGDVSANYYINSVVNNSSDSVSVASVVAPRGSIARNNLGWNGHSLIVSGPSVGEIKVYEDGSKCPGASWAAKIEHGTQKWGFAYEGNGAINITINADFTVTVGGSGTPGGNGRVVPGGCDAAPAAVTVTGCAQPGVESSCVVLQSGGVTYEISSAHPSPAWDHYITVTGTRTGGASTCQQGTPLTVTAWSYIIPPPGACPARPANPLRDPGPPYNP